MKKLEALYRIWKKLKNAYILNDGTIILGNMRCFRPNLKNIKCKECGEYIERGEEYWMHKDESWWKGEMGEPFEDGYCRECTAENKVDVLLRKPAVFVINESESVRYARP